MKDKHYTAFGKQVLCDGQHFADCCSPDAARFVAVSMNFPSWLDEQAVKRASRNQRFVARVMRIIADAFRMGEHED